MEFADPLLKSTYTDTVPADSKFAAPAYKVIDNCLPYLLASSSGHFRKTHQKLLNVKLDNAVGHVMEGLESYFNDCQTGYAEWSENSARCFILHDSIEDYDDFVDVELNPFSAAPNKRILEQMQKDGINDFVLAVVLTCTKSRKSQGAEDNTRDSNFLDSLSIRSKYDEYTGTFVYSEDNAIPHFNQIANKLYEYGYIEEENIPEWFERFSQCDYEEVMSQSRRVKLRDRLQSIGQDFEMMNLAISMGRKDVSCWKYIEKTRALIDKLYLGCDISTQEGLESLPFGDHITDEEVHLFNTLNNLMHTAMDQEVKRIFEWEFVTEANIDRLAFQTAVIKDTLFGGGRLPSHVNLSVILKDYIFKVLPQVAEDTSEVPLSHIKGRLSDKLNHTYPEIFTKDRLNSNTLTYAISTIVSEYAFRWNAKRWLASEKKKQQTTGRFERIRFADIMNHLDYYDIEGFVKDATNCFAEISSKSTEGISQDDYCCLNDFYIPILNELGLKSLSRAFVERLKYPGNRKYVDRLMVCQNVEEKIVRGVGLAERTITKNNILNRLLNGFLLAARPIVVNYGRQRERLKSLGWTIDNKDPYQGTLNLAK